jgi:hypothetical protein
LLTVVLYLAISSLLCWPSSSLPPQQTTQAAVSRASATPLHHHTAGVVGAGDGIYPTGGSEAVQEAAWNVL